jgi:integrase
VFSRQPTGVGAAVAGAPAGAKASAPSWRRERPGRAALNLPAATAIALYTAYVLVLGLRRGELLGLTWELVDLDSAQLYIEEQVQQANGQLIRHRTKTEASEAPLPLPDVCVTALKLRKEQQDADRERAGDVWIDTGLVFTTRHGTPIEPRNFNRSFSRRTVKAGVSRIKLHGTRRTCGSLLAALDVHPRVAMQILWRSRIAVTMEIYTEIPSAATHDALKKLGRWLDT